MATPKEPKREHPSTYVVSDRSNVEELMRITLQDRLVTKSMGGVLPEQADPTRLRRLLDVGCGTGGWLLEAAATYPTLSDLIGVDVSSHIVTYARDQATIKQLSDRVRFHTMDALRLLEFPDSSFDLVNQRFGMSYLRTWDWPKILQEFRRVARPGGTIRITEAGAIESTSPALTQLGDMLLRAFSQAGHLFTPNMNGVTSALEHLLPQHGLLNVQTRAYALQYQVGTPEGQLFFEDMQHVYRTILPFLRKWTSVPNNYDEIYQQALSDMQQKDFVATWHLLTAWGNTPPKKEARASIHR